MTDEQDISSLERSMHQLKMAYEKYFAGIERVAPARERDSFKKLLRQSIAQKNPNTARRFRLMSLQASLLALESHWDRISRQIEEGTYKRDLLRAEQKSRQQGEPGAEPPPAPPPAPTAPTNTGPAYPESLKKLHAAYIAAVQQTGAHSGVIPIETLANVVSKQITAVKEKFQCKSVEFRVEIKEGKPILKAIPK